MSTPIIGIVCCQKDIEGQPGQAAHNKYINSISHFGGMPVLLPSQLADKDDLHRLLDSLDGLLLTGSYSNVAPHRYDAGHEETCLDEARDSLTFTLLDYATANDLPVFGVCRGLQEMNVYFGGTLYPDLFVNPDFTEKHKEDAGAPQSEQYLAAHDIHIAEGGVLAEFGAIGQVNSLHKQAIKDLAPPLFAEATAPDGLVEAISHPKHRHMVGVQWHPEWQPENNPLSQFLFNKLIQQADEYRKSKK
ncbi:MAG: gamma-glutamyl-gamma-aminobutyrate hydrolase [Gammaproteobacteria bacterium]|nr:MAG: gamma-glutamyl-gamma-aminobutyrate hydrolase [Gammaproteobacteria bacterium]